MRVELESPTASFVFGRDDDCDLVLDAGDRAISRQAGRICWDGVSWVVRNTSGTRPLYQINEAGLRAVVPTGASATIPGGVSRILVIGGVYAHELRVCLGDPGSTGDPSPGGGAGDPSPVGQDSERTLLPAMTRNERAAVVALVEGYLHDHPRYDPRPRTYAEAADRLDLPVATVRKRIENLRQKLLRSGVVELDAPDARAALAEFVLATRLVDRADLALLDEA